MSTRRTAQQRADGNGSKPGRQRAASGVRIAVPRSVTQTLTSLVDSERDGGRVVGRPIATGFDLLDRVLEGGLRRHDLVLLGGAPGIGKTVAALQMARHAARHGTRVLYLSYEHDEATMLGRLLALELGEMSHPEVATEIDRLRGVVTSATAGHVSLDAALTDEPLLVEARERITEYADRLLLASGSGAHTDVSAIGKIITEAEVDRGGLLVVDYLQKVATRRSAPDEAEKITRVSEALKDLALDREVALLALVAADSAGLRDRRIRLHHLRGSSALAYECDVAVLMNSKYDVVSKVHLTYDTVRAESFRQQVVFTIEKNRGGPSMVDLEFRQDFLHYRFDPRGSYMAERAADERLDDVGV